MDWFVTPRRSDPPLYLLHTHTHTYFTNGSSFHKHTVSKLKENVSIRSNNQFTKKKISH